jgi:hypothetical protein
MDLAIIVVIACPARLQDPGHDDRVFYNQQVVLGLVTLRVRYVKNPDALRLT